MATNFYNNAELFLQDATDFTSISLLYKISYSLQFDNHIGGTSEIIDATLIVAIDAYHSKACLVIDRTL